MTPVADAPLWFQLRSLRDRGVTFELIDGRLCFSTAASAEARADALILLTKHSWEIRRILESEARLNRSALLFVKWRLKREAVEQ